MDGEQVNPVNKLTAAQPRVKAGKPEGGRPKPAPNSSVNDLPEKDSVQLSAESKKLLNQQAGAPEAEGAQALNRELEVIEDNQVVLKIRDQATNKVVKQIPAEELVRLRQAINNVIDEQTGDSG
ncbi:MAG: flagellar protein FlaG [Nitrospinaceae bacterium]